mmetsp:Transcript_2328/g.4709  ORF Transcript_2328/g.4709 Transcript_2328/m.4709 type:complete len:177 (-) Transcript_2328:163-693(-)
MESLLSGLPSQGFFTSTNSGTFLKSSAQRIPTYVCEHDTAPPEHQIITTDPTNILIRDLTYKKNKEERTQKGKTEIDPKGKRPADSIIPPEAKRMFTVASAVASGSGQRESSGAPSGSARSTSDFTESVLNNSTVDMLKAYLKEKNLSTKGRKEELVVRILQYQDRRAKASRPLLQ